jgi:RNA polymerase sigma factor (sigma-70 family)
VILEKAKLMSLRTTPPLLLYVRNLGAQESLKNVPDCVLVKRFALERDETAFAVMVRRHGRTVHHVCRSMLQNQADADDAFQATFLVLARQARSIRNKGSLASWLYGVAYRTCLKARAARATRQHYEAQIRPAVPPTIVDELSWREAQAILHDELARLPEKYRAPLVLCYLEGQRQDEAARLLGWPPGKIRSMLERARTHLRGRLLRRGLGPSAGLLAAMGNAWAAPPPQALAQSTVRFAASLVFQQDQVGISTSVLCLAEAMTQTMALRKIKIIAGALLLLLAALGLAALAPDPAVVAEERTAPASAAATYAVKASPKMLSLPAKMPKVHNVSARASSTWETNTPNRAFDGDRNTVWNAGDYAPQWLEADLGRSMRLGSISLIVIQLPEGETTHEIWVSDEPMGSDFNRPLQPLLLDPALPHVPVIHRVKPPANGAKLAHTFQGYTKDNQVLAWQFPTEMFARYVQIRTTQSLSWVAWVDVELCAQSRPK